MRHTGLPCENQTKGRFKQSYYPFRETKTVLNLLKDTRGVARDKVKQIAARFPYEFVKQQTSSTESSSSTSASWNRSRANSQTLDANIVSQDVYLVNLLQY